MHYIGIDPGVAGGIAILSDTGLVIDKTRMPVTVKDTVDWIRERLTWFGSSDIQTRAVIEKVNPGAFGAAKFGQRMGVVSAFTFGRGVGRLEAILAALEISYDEVLPAQWQAVMQCRTRGNKNISKARAQQLFPHLKVTHAIADALLLAEYCRRFHRRDRLEVSHGKKEKQTGVRQLSEAEGAREDSETAGGEELTASERRRQPFEGWTPRGRTRRTGGKGPAVAGAPGDGAGPGRRARSAL